MPDIFDKVASQEVNSREGSLRAGRYVLAVKELRFHQGFKGDSFIFTFKVKNAQALSPDGQPNPEGDTVTVAYNISKPKTGVYAMHDVKRFSAALLNKPINSIDGAALRELVDPMNQDKIEGADVRATVEPSDRCNANGEPYLNTRWSSV